MKCDKCGNTERFNGILTINVAINSDYEITEDMTEYDFSKVRFDHINCICGATVEEAD